MIRIALDIGSRKHRYAMSVDGKIEEDELVNERPVLLAFFKLAKRDRDVRVVMEQTGVYHWEAALAAHAAGLEVVLISPRQSVNFARALNTRTKTDRVDARMLLQYLERMPFERWHPPGNHLMELRTIARYLAGLTDQLTAAQPAAPLRGAGRRTKVRDACASTGDPAPGRTASAKAARRR
ncbi:MAG: transposase [Rhodanobacteraceae bacterium]|nr:transposase [Rhodanobacteraceae bacterium]